jgi:hypothetical protein
VNRLALLRNALWLCLAALFSVSISPTAALAEEGAPASTAAQHQEECKAEENAPPCGVSSEQKPPTTTEATPGDPGASLRANAQKSLEKAKQASAHGKSAVSKRLEGAAKLWERAANAQVKAAKLERDASDVERKTLELEAQARRAQSLLAQAETRRARALARLRELGLEESPAEAPSSGAQK